MIIFAVCLASALFVFFIFNRAHMAEISSEEETTETPLNKPIGTIVAVAGEGFQNEDGTPRQKIIAKLTAREIVTLVLEPENRFDKKAIAVISKRGQIGYVAKADASHPYLYARLREGRPVNASVLNIIGGTPDKPSRGVWLDVDIDIRNKQKRLKRAKSS